MAASRIRSQSRISAITRNAGVVGRQCQSTPCEKTARRTLWTTARCEAIDPRPVKLRLDGVDREGASGRVRRSRTPAGPASRPASCRPQGSCERGEGRDGSRVTRRAGGRRSSWHPPAPSRGPRSGTAPGLVWSPPMHVPRRMPHFWPKGLDVGVFLRGSAFFRTDHIIADGACRGRRVPPT